MGSRWWPRTAVIALLVYAAGQAVLELHDLYLSTWEHHPGDPSLFGMPLRHEAMLNQMSSPGLSGGYLIKGGFSPILEFISQLETAYALLWLVVIALFAVLVAGPLRAGHRWAWGACWLMVAAHVTAAACFGPYSAELLRFHAISAAIPAGLLVTMIGDVTRRTESR